MRFIEIICMIILYNCAHIDSNCAVDMQSAVDVSLIFAKDAENYYRQDTKGAISNSTLVAYTIA